MTTKRKKPSAFNKPVEVTAELATIVGPGPMARTEITKRVWDYIKKNKLQDTKNKRMINPDAKLGKILGSAQIDMFKMTAKIAKHIKQPSLAGSR